MQAIENKLEMLKDKPGGYFIILLILLQQLIPSSLALQFVYHYILFIYNNGTKQKSIQIIFIFTETKRDLFKNELQLNFSLLEDALKSEKINEKRNSKKDKNSIVQEDAMKSIGSEKNENERQESESGKDLDEKQGNGGNKIEEQRSLKKNLAFSHTLNHVVDVEQGNLILYRHFRNRKDQEVEKGFKNLFYFQVCIKQ